MFLYLENQHDKLEVVNTDHVIRIETGWLPNQPKDSTDEWIDVYLMPDGKYRRYKGTIRDFVLTVERLGIPQGARYEAMPPDEAALAEEAQRES